MNLHVTHTSLVMSPDCNEPRERWGVFNPASARSAHGRLYLFPRMVAEGNYSRVGIARVEFDAQGNPRAVKRLGMALEPEAAYELIQSPVSGGVEDPRITYVSHLRSYVMVYCALGPAGPRVALAISNDLFAWKRLGVLHFAREGDTDLNRYVNKDGVLFPEPVLDPAGKPALAILHRPTPLISEEGDRRGMPRLGGVDDHPSIWVSYVALESVRSRIDRLTHVYGHSLLASPQQVWESDRIGAGPPPILTDEGWLLFYHGVFRVQPSGTSDTGWHTVYHGGAMLLDRQDPRRILWRSSKPLLHPSETHGLYGNVPRVVFPTAVDARGSDIDVYCGAADSRIAVSRVRIDAHILGMPSAPSKNAVLPGAAEGKVA